MSRRGPLPTPVLTSKTLFGKAFSELRATIAGVSTRELAQRAGYKTADANLWKYEKGVLLPPPRKVILLWLWHLGYPEGAVETIELLALAADDHCAAIQEHYGVEDVENKGS